MLKTTVSLLLTPIENVPSSSLIATNDLFTVIWEFGSGVRVEASLTIPLKMILLSWVLTDCPYPEVMQIIIINNMNQAFFTELTWLKLKYQFVKTPFWNMVNLLFIPPVFNIIIHYIIDNDRFHGLTQGQNQKNLITFRNF